MFIFLTILAVVVIFSILVLIHEYGHFVAARRAGIKVLEFGIGFPPRLFKKKIGETIYSVNAIPFGGFVRLYGEDASDPEVLKDKRSFASKSPWIRTKVVCAGVFMNFMLAIALLTIGFTFGIEPLLMNHDDLFYHIGKGNVVSSPGIFVSKVSDEARASGIQPGDKIVAIDDEPVLQPSQAAIFKKGEAAKDVDVTVSRAGGQAQKIHLPVSSAKSFGVDLKPYTEFPNVGVLEVKPGSASAKAGLKAGDLILQINGKPAYEPADFDAAMSLSSKLNFQILRGAEAKNLNIDLPDSRRVAIAEVYRKTAAEAAGFRKGDVVLKMDSTVITAPDQVIKMLQDNPGKLIAYRISRGGKEFEIQAKASEKNFLGILLSPIASFRNSEISVYRGTALASITEIKKVSYGPWTAFKQAISESVRLTGLTIAAFGKTIGTIVSKFSVPDEIGGPVQIAVYTHAFIQEGFFAVLRFMALLSLSLAVINVLPIPALDGGRFLFIIVEVISGRKVNARLEAAVHSIGFALLMLLIILVTYSDITKLF